MTEKKVFTLEERIKYYETQLSELDDAWEIIAAVIERQAKWTENRLGDLRREKRENWNKREIISLL